MTIDQFYGECMGLKCAWITNGQIRLAVTTERGPRGMFFGWQDGPNLFAELPDISIPSKNGPYHLLGGHRLWHASRVEHADILARNAAFESRCRGGPREDQCAA